MPVLGPPPGGDVSRGPALLAVSIVFGVLSTASTTLRIGVRAFTRNLGWDDLTIAIAVILLDVQTVFTGLVYHAGGGRHVYYLSPNQARESLKWNYVSEVLLFLIIPFTKISICFFVLRIKNTGWLKWLLYGLMIGLMVTTVVPIVILFTQCRPIKAFWNKSAGTCWSPRVLNDVNYAQVAYSIFSDGIISFLPIIILWNVQMRVHLKIAVCALMSLGLIATACAAVRMSLFTGNLGSDLNCMTGLPIENREDLNRSDEPSGNRALISIWCGLEENLAVICANLALSRYIYLFFRNSGWNRKVSYQGSSTRKQHPTSMSTLLRRKHLETKSEDSVIPLGLLPIRKTTEVHQTAEDALGKPRNSQDPYMLDASTTSVEDRV